MTPSVIPPQNIAVMANPNISEALEVAREVGAMIREMGAKAEVGSLYDDGLRESVKTKAFDLLIALGGDGTMLRAGHLCAPVDVPLLGINIGHFGFLVELKREEWPATCRAFWRAISVTKNG
jgi:NAD+ kinase